MFETNLIDLKLDEEMTTLLELMGQEQDKSTDKYVAMSKQLASLHELRHKNSISKDALVNVAANIAGIVLILNYERAGVIASKAFSLVKKIF